MFMRKLFLFLFLFVSCENPLNIDYTKEFYLRDLRIIEDYDKFAAKKIEFVFYYENPKEGTSYKEILNRFSEIEKEITIKDSLLRLMVEKQIELLDELKLKIDSIN